MRTLSAPTQTEIAKPDNALGYLLEITFPSYVGRYSTTGDVTWNGLLFVGSSLRVLSIDPSGKSASVQVFDDDASLRTLCVTDQGARNGAVNLWKFYVSALGASDPFKVFKGVGDEAKIAKGLITLSLLRASIDGSFCPRKRLGNATDVNFLAAPGTVVPWGGGSLILQPQV